MTKRASSAEGRGMATASIDTSAIEENKLWPKYESPDDLADIETVPLAERGLPDSTYSLLVRAAALWPHGNALAVIPDASRWREPMQCSYSQLLIEVHRCANLLHSVGVRRRDAVALIAPNCAELITATLAAQVAGIAAPINGVCPGLTSRSYYVGRVLAFSLWLDLTCPIRCGSSPSSSPAMACWIPCWHCGTLRATLGATRCR